MLNKLRHLSTFSSLIAPADSGHWGTSLCQAAANVHLDPTTFPLLSSLLNLISDFWPLEYC